MHFRMQTEADRGRVLARRVPRPLWTLLCVCTLVYQAAVAASAFTVSVGNYSELYEAILHANNQPVGSPVPMVVLDGMIAITALLPNILRPLVLRGREDGAPSGLQCSKSTIPHGVLIVTTTGVVLQGLTIQRCSATAVVIETNITAGAGVTLSHCTFLNNSGTYAGAVEVRSTWGPANVTFDSCVFKLNTVVPDSDVSNKSAAAIYGGLGTYMVRNCTFSNNGFIDDLSGSGTIRYCSSCVLRNASMVVHLDWSRIPDTWPASLASQASSCPVMEKRDGTCMVPLTLRLDLLNSTFLYNTASGSTLVQMNRPEYSVSSSVMSVQTGLQGITGCSVHVADTSFTSGGGDTFSMFGDVGTAFCSTTLRNVTVVNNTGISTGSDWPTGGTFLFLSQDCLRITDSNFTSNVGSNSVLRLVQIGSVAIHNSLFLGSRVMWSGAILAQNLNILEFDSCTLARNYANLQGGAMDLFGITKVHIHNSTVQENGSLDSGGIRVDESNLVVTKTQFVGNIGWWWGGALTVRSGRYTEIRDSDFINNLAFSGGGILLDVGMPYQSTLIVNCTFQNNVGKAGGAVSIRDNQHMIEFLNCTFIENSVLQLPMTEHYRAFDLFKMIDYGQGWLLADQETSGIEYYLNLKSCGRSGGGAICVSGSAQVVIDQCTFLGNSAMYGGAIHVKLGRRCQSVGTCFTVDIYNTTMKDNFADGGAGAALFAQVENLYNIHCDDSHGHGPGQGGYSTALVGIRSNSSAALGAVGDLTLQKLPCATWNHNGANARNAYGSAVATSAMSLSLMTPAVVTGYHSATPLQIKLVPRDLFGQRAFYTERPMYAKMDSLHNPMPVQEIITLASSACNLDSQVKATNVNGTIEFSDIRVRAPSGNCSIILKTTASCGPRLYQLPTIVVLVQVQGCRINQVASPDNTKCYDCIHGFYSLDGSKTVCEACPVGANCSMVTSVYSSMTAQNSSPLVMAAIDSIVLSKSSNSVFLHARDTGLKKRSRDRHILGVIVPLNGYWHAHPFSTQLHPCKVHSACSWLGRANALAAVQAALAHEMVTMNSTTEYQRAQCATGSTGNLCAQVRWKGPG